MNDEIGPRMAGGRTAIRGQLGMYLRARQAERKLSDADLQRGHRSVHHTNLGEYLRGLRFPDNRPFQELIDSFRNAGNGLFFTEIKDAERLWFAEAPAWDRYTAGQTEWVSETHLASQKRASRSTRASKRAGGKNVSKANHSGRHDKGTAGEGGFEPPIG